MSETRVLQLKWSLAEGPSQSGLFSEEVRLTHLDIRPPEADVTSLRRLWTTIPDCTQQWAVILKRATEVAGGRPLLVTVKPEVVAFRPGTDEYDDAVKLLDNEVKRPHGVYLKTAHPTARMSENFAKYIPYHFVLDVDHPELLHVLISRFRTFEMLRFFVLGIDADQQEIASQLQSMYLDRKFLLDDLVEDIQAVASFEYFGERLYLESTSEEFIRRITEGLQVMSQKETVQKQAKITRHSIWWGRKKLFEW